MEGLANLTTAASSSEMSLSFAFLSSAKKSRDGNAGDRVVSGKTLAGGQTEEMARGQSPLACEALVPKKEKENVDNEEGRDTADVHSISGQASAGNSRKQGTAAEAFLSLLDIPVAQMPQKSGVRGGELSGKGCVNRSGDHLLSMASQSFAMLSVRKCDCVFCECECESVCVSGRSL